MNFPKPIQARDLQLMERGWEFNSVSGAYRLPPDGEWLPVVDARIAAGLDIPTMPAPLRYTMSMTTGGGVVALRLTDEFVEQLRKMDVPIFPVTFATAQEANAAVAFIERVIGVRIMAGWKTHDDPRT